MRRKKESKSKGSDLGWVEGRGGGVGGTKDKLSQLEQCSRGSYIFQLKSSQGMFCVLAELHAGGPDPQALGRNGSRL